MAIKSKARHNLTLRSIKHEIAALLLAACLVESASAVTPTYKPPKLPDMSDVKIEVSVPTLKFSSGYFDYLFKNIKISADKLPKLK